MNFRMNWMRSRIDRIEKVAVLIKAAIDPIGSGTISIGTATNSIEIDTDPIGSALFSIRSRRDRMH